MSDTLAKLIDEAIETWKEDLAHSRSIREEIQDMNSYGAGHEDGVIDTCKLTIRQLIALREAIA